jgi:DNA-binding protein HU-beta
MDNKAFSTKDLVDLVANTHRLTKTAAREVVDTVLKSIGDNLKEGKQVDLSGFGKFKVKEIAARTGRNVRTGEPIQIPAKKSPAFSAAKKLKDTVAA